MPERPENDVEQATSSNANDHAPVDKPPCNRLSTISRKYDRGDKGYLDDAEALARAFDSGSGHPSIERVIVALESLAREKEKTLNMKKAILGLIFFTLLLTVANIGSAFAAAKLAKDTETFGIQFTDREGHMLQTGSGTYVFTLTQLPTTKGGSTLSRRNRHLQGDSYTVSSTYDIPKADAQAIVNLFKNVATSTVRLDHCPDVITGEPTTSTLLTGMTTHHANWRDATFTTSYGTNVDIDCIGNDCTVSGLHPCNTRPCQHICTGFFDFCENLAEICFEGLCQVPDDGLISPSCTTTTPCVHLCTSVVAYCTDGLDVCAHGICQTAGGPYFSPSCASPTE